MLIDFLSSVCKQIAGKPQYSLIAPFSEHCKSFFLQNILFSSNKSNGTMAFTQIRDFGGTTLRTLGLYTINHAKVMDMQAWRTLRAGWAFAPYPQILAINLIPTMWGQIIPTVLLLVPPPLPPPPWTFGPSASSGICNCRQCYS